MTDLEKIAREASAKVLRQCIIPRQMGKADFMKISTAFFLEELKKVREQTIDECKDKLFYEVSEWCKDRDGDEHRPRCPKNNILNEAIEELEQLKGE